MFNDLDSDLPFYKKMSEVYSSEVAVARSKREENAKQQLEAAIASGIVTDYGHPLLDKNVNQGDAEGANIQGEPLDIDSA